ncbi:MAG: phosphate ABC transporter permease subunit PstC [Coriobacteriia bacterium]|nr:phosphate ABC transporter permease subunit PstC [Coriobacteriia bacterium]
MDEHKNKVSSMPEEDNSKVGSSAVDAQENTQSNEVEAGKEGLRTDADPSKKTLTHTPSVVMKELADTAAQREPVPEARPATKLQLVSRSTQIKEASLATLFFVCAFLAVLGAGLIFAFVAWRAFPLLSDIGLWNFLTGTQWSVADNTFGALPFILGSFVVVGGSLVLGVPLAVLTAVFMSEVASPRANAIIRPAVELLAGVPSVVVGFFGVVVVVPIVSALVGGAGFGPLTAWIVLSIMIMPTITTLSEDALNSIPMGIREASYAMGATKWQTIWKVVIPAARIGIIDATILGMGRAIGETMAVLMVVGNAPQLFAGISAPISTMTSQIVLEMGYSSGEHRTALFGLAAILFLISMSLVLTVRLLAREQTKKTKKVKKGGGA